jgi:RNA 2',3'-cyclic 3'-phosphodiesterase
VHEHRLFVGIEIDENARRAFADVAERLRKRFSNLRFVDPDNYHLTLVFLGNVADDALAPIEAALPRIASRHRRFQVTFERLGAFPHERKARIIYVGCRGAPAEYRRLALDANREMNALGYGDEKDDVPHVTLARVVERKRFRLPMFDVSPTCITIESLTLFESVPRDGKTFYETRASVRLAP